MKYCVLIFIMIMFLSCVEDTINTSKSSLNDFLKLKKDTVVNLEKGLTKIDYLKSEDCYLVSSYYDKEGDTLKSEIKYCNSLKEGTEKLYYKNGGYRQVSRYVQGVKWGQAFIFYKSGKIKQYLYFLESGDLGYRRKYDENSDFIEEKGTAFPNVNINSARSKIQQFIKLGLKNYDFFKFHFLIFFKKLDF